MEIGRGSGSKGIEIPLLVIVPMLAAYVVALELSRDTLDIVVEDKNVVMGSEDSSDPSSKWLVYTSNEVFTVAGTGPEVSSTQESASVNLSLVMLIAYRWQAGEFHRSTGIGRSCASNRTEVVANRTLDGDPSQRSCRSCSSDAYST